ncbi:TRAP transporter substrate-binding protein DctP [Trichloromonas sp.]|uniref:TRAP transporter substrate-binding protein n=1 Tax=Trichloromonas sp. TaxID=3069249 RepID=UPI003D812D6E
MRYLLFILLLILFGAFPASAATLKLATLAPEGSAWMTQMREGAAEIKERTSGRVVIKLYGGGVMGNEKSMLRKIRIGQLQGGAFTGGGLAEIYPDLRIYSLPLLFSSLAEVDHVRAELDPVLKAGLEQNGFVSFGFAEGGFALLMGNHPITLLEHLKNQKLWVPEGDGVTAAVMQELGLSPITLPISDVLTGLQTGLVHIVGVSPIGALAFQWHTKVKYITKAPMAYLFATLAIDKGAFDKLSEADRQLVREVMERVYRRFDADNRADEQVAIDALRRDGLTFVSPQPGEVEAMRQRAGKALERLSAEGAFSPQMYNRVGELVRAYRAQAPP